MENKQRKMNKNFGKKNIIEKRMGKRNRKKEEKLDMKFFEIKKKKKVIKLGYPCKYY